MILAPALLLGVWQWREFTRSFGIALGLVTAGQFLLPAHHATWSGALPIPNVYTAIEGFQHLPIDLHPRFHLNASLASEQAGDLTRAAWSCDAALRLDDRFAAAYGQRASLRLRESRIAEAEADVGAALHLDPGQADALFVRADISASRGETHSAVLELRRALASARTNGRGATWRNNCSRSSLSATPRPTRVYIYDVHSVIGFIAPRIPRLASFRRARMAVAT